MYLVMNKMEKNILKNNQYAKKAKKIYTVNHFPFNQLTDIMGNGASTPK